MINKYDFKAALEDFNESIIPYDNEQHALGGVIDNQDCNAIQTALRLADRLQNSNKHAGRCPFQGIRFIEHTKKFLNCHPNDDETAWAWLHCLLADKIMKEVEDD